MSRKLCIFTIHHDLPLACPHRVVWFRSQCMRGRGSKAGADWGDDSSSLMANGCAPERAVHGRVGIQ